MIQSNIVIPQWDAPHDKQKLVFAAVHGASLIDVMEVQVGERFLDLGGGTGELTYAEVQRGAEVLNTETSAPMLAETRQSCPN